MARVLKLPTRDWGRPATGGASFLEVYRGRAVELLGRLLNKLGVPGAVRNVHFKDALTGQEIDVQVSALYTRISVNGRDYYFHRITGRFASSRLSRHK